MTDDEHPDAIPVRDHVEKDVTDECAYCGQSFGPDEIAIERVIYGRRWRFCSDQCLTDFRESSDFKDQDLDEDRADLQVHVNEDKTYEDDENL